MKEDLRYLIELCRASAPHLTRDAVLAKCRAAAEQKGNGRIRTTGHSREKMSAPELGRGGRGVKWADLQNALLTATDALWQEDHGAWKISGGTDRDGDPLIIATVVTLDSEDVYIRTALAP